MTQIEHPLSKSRISDELLASLSGKLIEGSSSWADRATLAHFTLNLDVAMGRAFADHLNGLLATLEPAMPGAEDSDKILALKDLGTFISLVVRGEDEENPDVTAAWDSFVSRMAYPEGNNAGPEGLDIEAGLQRLETAIAMKIIQTEFFGEIIGSYNP